MPNWPLEGAEVVLSTAGICLDVVGLQYNLISTAEIAKVVSEFPRLEKKQRMTRYSAARRC